jgi:predicted nucleotidyltransferase
MLKKTDETTKNMHRNALRLIEEQIKKHSLGKLVFLAFTGTRPWGIAQENVDYDYRGIYMPKRGLDFINEVYINNHAKDITMVSCKDFIRSDFNANIHALICLSSPIIYASKEFLKLREWINSHFSKTVYVACQVKLHGHTGRKDYLYDFFFLGNGIAILERKKVIANLSELNKKILKIPAMDKVIEEERTSLPFKTKTICEKILHQLKARLERANKESRLPEEISRDKFAKLKIVKKINHGYT